MTTPAPMRKALFGVLGAVFAAVHPALAASAQTGADAAVNAAAQAPAAAAAPAPDDPRPRPVDPDYRVINLPTAVRMPLHKSNFQLTHRFGGNLRRGDFGYQASNLFGLDQGAMVGFEYRFAIARRAQAAVYRTTLDKTFQFYGKYDAVSQNDT